MGTQQVLLIILTVVIVGLSVSAGFYTFQVQAKSSQRQAMIAQINTYVAEALTFRRIPTSLAGGGGSFEGFYPAGAFESEGSASNGDATVEYEDVIYYVEWYVNDRLKIIASSKIYGEGHSWNNTYNARITAVFNNLGEINSNGFEISGDWEGP